MADDVVERVQELEIKLAFQDHKIRELDQLVRDLAAQLAAAKDQLAQLEQTVRSPDVPLGPANELPPHY